MSCVKDIVCGNRTIIGIRDYVDCTNPESGLFIQDLPGISLKKASDAASEEFKTGKKLLQHCVSMASRHVYDEFITQLGPYFNFNAIVETRKLDIFSTQVLPMAPLERGIVFKRWRSEMAKIYIKEVYINVLQAGATTLKIIESRITSGPPSIVNPVKTTLVPVTLAIGVNTIQLDYVADSEQVYVIFDQTNFDTYNNAFNQIGNGCYTCGNSGSKTFSVTGWNGSIQSGQTFGLGGYANVRCYEEVIFCSLIQRMYFLLWYKAGIVFLEEFIQSTRINHMTLYGKDQAKELLANYQAKYQEKYEIILKSAYEFIKTTKGECLTCNGTRYVQSAP